MKTRKVGRLLALLLAIVLVAGIMAPASSVLAEESKYDGVTWTTVSTRTALRTALDEAPKGQTTYIRLTSNISLPSFVSYTRGDAGVDGGLSLNENSASPWVYVEKVTAKVSKVEKKDGLFWSDIDKSNATKSNKYTGITSSNLNSEIEVTAGKKLALGCDGDEKIGREYEQYKLIVHSGTNVVIDLNGKKIDGVNNNANPYSGSPKYQMSVLTVRGTLTVTDLNNGNGMITGGTGTATGGTTMKKTRDSSEKVYFDGGWAKPSTDSTDKTYRITYETYSYWYGGATQSKGGGVYVANGGKFYLENGKITGNVAWMKSDDKEDALSGGDSASDTGVFAEKKESWAFGGGVYVEGGGYFKMSGGEISANSARAYNKGPTGNWGFDFIGQTINSGANAAGGGVYLDKNATMDFTGGKVADNATSAETSLDSHNSVTSYGGGIYVGSGAVLNMMGDVETAGATTDEMRADFPQVTDNCSGGQTLKEYKDPLIGDPEYSKNNWAMGAGIFNDGTINLQKATVSANYFSEKNNDSNKSVYIVRDSDTGLPVPGSEAVNGRNDEANAPYTTKQVSYGSSGRYATHRAAQQTTIKTVGAGIYNNTNAKINIGERVWVYDNWDLVTNAADTPVSESGYRRWNGNEWAYYNGTETEDMAGYGWHDTRDDVYLPSGTYMYVADSLFECKIGINYDGMASTSNRTIVRPSSNLGSVWQNAGYNPKVRDIQFFFVNDENAPTSTSLKCAQDLDYVVTHVDGTTPYLAFAKRATDNSNRNTYVTFDFTDSNVTYYVDKNYKNTTDKWYTSTKTPYETFTGQRVGYDLNKLLIPDYDLYKSNWTSLIGAVGSKTTIHNVTLANNVTKEAPDLYFKGWQYYASYGNYNVYADKAGVADTSKNLGTMIIPTGSRVAGTSTSTRSTPFYFFNYNKAAGDQGAFYNDNFNYQYVPSFNTSWYSQDELIEARKNISNVMVQRVKLSSAPEKNYLRFLALVGPNYAAFDEAGFVFSTTNATPTIEGGYDFSVKEKIYKKIWTINTKYPNGAWVNIGNLLNLKTAAGDEADFDWAFTDNSVFETAGIKLDKHENPNAGILYTNLEIPAGQESTVYYVTPYYKDANGYHYGESRAISYNWVLSKDQGANMMSVD